MYVPQHELESVTLLLIFIGIFSERNYSGMKAYSRDTG